MEVYQRINAPVTERKRCHLSLIFTANSKAKQKFSDAGEDVKVMSVLGAGAGGAIDLNDLGLKKHYSVMNAALATPTYTDLMFEVSFRGTQLAVCFKYRYLSIGILCPATRYCVHPYTPRCRSHALNN